MPEKTEVKFEFDPESHIYKVGGIVIPSVTEVLGAEGFISSYGASESDRIRGRYVHRICELSDLNDLDMDSVDPALMPRLTAWNDAKKALGIKTFDAIEYKMYSKKWMVAGTLDRVKADILVDIKSGGKQAGFALQTGGYKVLWEERIGEKIRKRASVYLTEDGKFSVDWHKDKDDDFMFLCALKSYKWKRLRGIA
ncbi:MAG TPA: hypothetical protein P5110_06820 [Candidatus Omnitrophota bacterium]|nr:hypothetical protein [Candidatus Omnitrophota bacterium]